MGSWESQTPKQCSIKYIILTISNNLINCLHSVILNPLKYDVVVEISICLFECDTSHTTIDGVWSTWPTQHVGFKGMETKG